MPNLMSVWHPGDTIHATGPCCKSSSILDKWGSRKCAAGKGSMLPCYVLIIGVRNAGRDSMATTVWLALTLWLVMMIGELGIVTQSVTSLASNIEVEMPSGRTFRPSHGGMPCGPSRIGNIGGLDCRWFSVSVAALCLSPCHPIEGR